MVYGSRLLFRRFFGFNRFFLPILGKSLSVFAPLLRCVNNLVTETD